VEWSASRSGRCTSEVETVSALDRRTGGPQSQSGRYDEDINDALSDLNPGGPACSLLPEISVRV
jgi:hypothetical protein